MNLKAHVHKMYAFNEYDAIDIVRAYAPRHLIYCITPDDEVYTGGTHWHECWQQARADGYLGQYRRVRC
jgi:hypothetical protein